MLEVGGITRLHLVIVTFRKDVFRGCTRNRVARCPVSILNSKEVITVGVVHGIPIDLSDRWIAVNPSIILLLILGCAMRMAFEITGQILVVIRTWVRSLTPFQASLTCFACEVVKRRVERSLLVRRPVPSKVHEGLVIGAHAGITLHLSTIVVNGLVSPERVVVVGTNQVVGFLHYRGRTASLRRCSEDSEIETVFVVDLLLHREEVAGCPIEGSFGIALTSITSAGCSHQVPAFPNLTRTHRCHHAMVVGTVREGVTQRDLLPVLRGTSGNGRQTAKTTKAGVGETQAFHDDRVTHGIVESAPISKDWTARLRVVHQDTIDHHIGILRVVSANTKAKRTKVECGNGVEDIT